MKTDLEAIIQQRDEEQNLVELRTETESNEYTLWSLKCKRDIICSDIAYLQNLLKRVDENISAVMEAIKDD